MSDKDMKAAAGQGAFMIFSELVVSNAVDKNDEIRSENASLRAPRDLLLKVQVRKGEEILWEGSLLDCREDDEDAGENHFILHVENVLPFPLEEITQLFCISGGFSGLDMFQTLQWGHNQSCYVKEDETVEMNLEMGQNCVVVGALENFAGTVEYMKQMIKDNRLLMYLHEFGFDAIDPGTGEPAERQAQFHDPNVEGSTFRVTKIKLSKNVIQPILDQENIAVEKAANDETVKEMQQLSKTYQSNDTLRIALEEQTTLLKENILLKSSRDTVQTVQVCHPGGVAHGNITQGSRSTFRGGIPSWMVKFPSDDGRISLLDVCRMKISLSGFPIDPSGMGTHMGAMGAQMAPNFTYLRLPYSDTVSAFFVFDAESWNNINLDTVLEEGRYHFVDWLRVQLAGGNNERVQYNIPDYTGPELFLKLILVEFRIDCVRRSLDALGVSIPEEEEDGDDGGEM